MVDPLIRDTAIACAGLAAGAWILRPDQPRLAAGVVGGGLLMGLSIWAIHGAVAQVASRARMREMRPVSRAFLLVKFFTRHAILALAAYGMMVRLRLDPIGMCVGVTAAVVAAAVEAGRRR